MKVSIVIPFTFSAQWSPLLARCLHSIEKQVFTDYEIILLKYGRAAETQNRLFEMAEGELIKILHADDYFSDQYSLGEIVSNFSTLDYWQVSGCMHSENFNEPKYPHLARYSSDIHTGNNTIGAPSVLTFRNDLGVTFDADLDWLYDVSLYKKLFDQYGPPAILDKFPVTIGLHAGQLTHRVPDERKLSEIQLMRKRYA